jgi:hypothetical protein
VGKGKGGEMNDFAKCFGENCPLKENCKRYSEGIGATDWFVAPMYNKKTKKCMNYYPINSENNQKLK